MIVGPCPKEDSRRGCVIPCIFYLLGSCYAWGSLSLPGCRGFWVFRYNAVRKMRGRVYELGSS